MFCGNCGKEIPNDSNVCGYCGSRVEALTGSGRNFVKKPNGYKPDNKFNIWAFLFPPIWALVHGLVDLGLSIFGIAILVGIIPGIGILLELIFMIAVCIFMGRNGNYYYRLKKEQQISALAALKDPDFRRF